MMIFEKRRVIRVDPGRSNPYLHDLLRGFSHHFSYRHLTGEGLTRAGSQSGFM